MNRRGFLGRVAMVGAAVLGVTPKRPPPLAFRRDAFAMVSEPLRLERDHGVVTVHNSGISRVDCLYGHATFGETFTARIGV